MLVACCGRGPYGAYSSLQSSTHFQISTGEMPLSIFQFRSGIIAKPKSTHSHVSFSSLELVAAVLAEPLAAHVAPVAGGLAVLFVHFVELVFVAVEHPEVFEAHLQYRRRSKKK